MASPLSVLKRVIPLNLVHVESWETVTRTVERYGESLEADEIRVHARPFRREQCRCPKCGRKCDRDGHRQEGEIVLVTRGCWPRCQRFARQPLSCGKPIGWAEIALRLRWRVRRLRMWVVACATWLRWCRMTMLPRPF